MLKTSTIAACVLALSAPVALAQSSWMTNWIPNGPSDAPGGANGAAPTRDVGQTSANVGATGDSRSTSSSILEQRLKQQSAAGATSPAYNTNVPAGYSSQAMTMDEPRSNSRRVYLTDEYGFHYNSRGDRIP
ncbi:MAG TPA: hypothetical protein VMI56_13975 [Reyranella sp.]|nr:hypothetical protein [Reyranella sp.]